MAPEALKTLQLVGGWVLGECLTEPLMFCHQGKSPEVCEFKKDVRIEWLEVNFVLGFSVVEVAIELS